jgi:predicted O-methyltransferase YrrM
MLRSRLSPSAWSIIGQAWKLRFQWQRPTLEQVREFVLRRMPSGGACAELGVSRGDFSARILAINKPRRLHLVDPWMQGGCELVTARFAEEIAEGIVMIHHETSESASARFVDDYFDWIYIDGNHFYDFVRTDLELYYAKVKRGGFIVCDDYHYPGYWEDGVTRAVDEFIESGRCQRMFKRRSQFVMRKL